TPSVSNEGRVTAKAASVSTDSSIQQVNTIWFNAISCRPIIIFRMRRISLKH
ncbi:hypothetical protein Pmar_PMAR001798, partial [Perkinsus marinus ATCC 50983]